MSDYKEEMEEWTQQVQEFAENYMNLVSEAQSYSSYLGSHNVDFDDLIREVDYVDDNIDYTDEDLDVDDLNQMVNQVRQAIENAESQRQEIEEMCGEIEEIERQLNYAEDALNELIYALENKPEPEFEVGDKVTVGSIPAVYVIIAKRDPYLWLDPAGDKVAHEPPVTIKVSDVSQFTFTEV